MIRMACESYAYHNFQKIADEHAKRVGMMIDSATLNRIAPTLNMFGWYKREDCHDIGDRGDFRCSKCLVEWQDSANHDFLYCPSCGARVVTA